MSWYAVDKMRRQIIVDILLLISFIVLVNVYINQRRTYVPEQRAAKRPDYRALSEVLAKDARLGFGKEVAKPVLSGISDVLDTRIERIPDARSQKCLNKRYKNSDATVSIIIDFFDYQFHDLKMTVSSVLANTPDELIGEIIVVDDGSTLDYIIQDSKLYVAGIAKAKLVRTSRRYGTPSARQSGVMAATGSVLVFLDTTVICNRGWLPPLLDALYREPSLIAVPHFDNINDPVSYEYRITSPFLVATFSWTLRVRMSVPGKLKSSRATTEEAQNSPALRGNAFAVTRKFFTKLDGYDRGLHHNGGEHLELSLRTWMCGGFIRVLPCSHVGVMSLHEHVRVGSAANAWRIAELWLEPMRTVIYRQTYANDVASQSWNEEVLARRKALSSLNCTSYDSYMKGAGSVLYSPAVDTTHFGLLRVRNGFCARAFASTDNRIELRTCSINYTSEQASNKVFEFHRSGEISVGNRCLAVSNHAYVETRKCIARERRQLWSYDEQSGRFVNDWSHLCLKHVTDPDTQDDEKRQVLMAQDCKSDKTKDHTFTRWEFVKL